MREIRPGSNSSIRQTKISASHRDTKSNKERCKKKFELGLACVGFCSLEVVQDVYGGSRGQEHKDGEGPTAGMGPGNGSWLIEMTDMAAWRVGRTDKLERLVGGHAVEIPECTAGVFISHVLWNGKPQKVSGVRNNLIQVIMLCK